MSKRITVIGAGPGGYTAAFDAAKKGAKVTLIEKKWLGGTCLNCGCIPTKTLKASAEAFEAIHQAKEYGITVEGSAAVDMPAVIARKEKVSATLRGGLEKTTDLLKVNVIMGTAKVISANLVEVTKEDGSVEKVESDDLIIATGSAPLNLPSLPVDHKYVLSSDDALLLNYVPKTMIIVGGGVIGSELAMVFNTFGTKVTIIEGADRILPVPSLDEELSKILTREMKKAGIKTEVRRVVDSVEIVDGKVKAKVVDSPFCPPATPGEAAFAEADVVISAVGRSANSKGLGLEELGMELNRGYIVANEYLETSIPHIWAIGDILGPAKIMLAHMAVAEALTVVQNIMGDKKVAQDYRVVPSAVFVTPEIGSVGASEAQLKKQGLVEGTDYKVELFQFRELGKAQAMGQLPGAFKLIVDAKTNKILGAHLAGAHSSDIIAEVTMAMQMGATVADIAHTIHSHPTLAEGIFEAAHRMA